MDLDGWVKEKLKRKLEGSDWRICGWDTHKESSYVYITKNDTDPDVFDEYDFGTMKLRYSYHDPVAFKSMEAVNVTISYQPSSGYRVTIEDEDDYSNINLDGLNVEADIDEEDGIFYSAEVWSDDESVVGRLIVDLWMNKVKL